MWWTGKAVGFDLETDSPDPTDARIITAATVAMLGEAPDEDEILVRPERPIDPGATEVHGITTEHATEHGIERESAVRHICSRLALAGAEVPVVGHNVAYDLTVLDREMRRTGVGRLDLEEGTGMVIVEVDRSQVACFPVLDTLVIDKAVDRYRPGKRQLSFMAEHYGVPMAEGAAHGATADVVASLRIAIAIAQRCGRDLGHLTNLYADRKYPAAVAREFQAMSRYDLADMQRMQATWSEQQAAGLREHFVKLNDPEKDPATVDGRWPVRPLDAADAVDAFGTVI